MSGSSPKVPVLRVARPTNDLRRSSASTCKAPASGACRVTDHDGFSGTILGFPGAPWHLEFVLETGQVAPRAESPENLLVLYLPDPDEWRLAVDRMTAHGYEPVPAHNPYWEVAGKTFEDPDGYRLVFQNRAWDL
ncbi:MAG: VOC family protein [Alphaproteobacteria bacterium]|nr:VOC family protein [Alphaproteobacteria bacterium]